MFFSAAACLEAVLSVGSFAAMSVAATVACHQALKHPLPAAAFVAMASAACLRQQQDQVESGIPSSLHPLTTIVAMVAGWVACLTVLPIFVRLVAYVVMAMVMALRFTFVTLPRAIVSEVVKATTSVVHLPLAFVTSAFKAAKLVLVTIPSKALTPPLKVVAYVVAFGIVPVIVAVLKISMVILVVAAKFVAVSSLSFAIAVIPDLVKLVAISIPCLLLKVLAKVNKALAGIAVAVLKWTLQLVLITIPLAVAAAAAFGFRSLVRGLTTPAVVAIPPIIGKGILEMIRLLFQAALFCCITIPGGFFAIVASEMAAAAAASAAAAVQPSSNSSNKNNSNHTNQQRPAAPPNAHRQVGGATGATGGRSRPPPPPPPPPVSSVYVPANHTATSNRQTSGRDNTASATGGRSRPPPPPPPPPVSSVFVPANHRDTTASGTGGRIKPPPPPPPRPAPPSSGYVTANHQHETAMPNRQTTGRNGHNCSGRTVVGATGGRIMPPPAPASSCCVPANHQSQPVTSNRPATGRDTVVTAAGGRFVPPPASSRHVTVPANSSPDLATSNGFSGREQQTRSASFHSSPNTNQARSASMRTVGASSQAHPPIPDRPCSNHRVPAPPMAPRHADQPGRLTAVVAAAPARAPTAAAVVPERPASNPGVRVAPALRQPGAQQGSAGGVARAPAVNPQAAPRPKMKSQKVRAFEAKRSLNLQADRLRSLASLAVNVARCAAAAVFPKGIFTPFRGKFQPKWHNAAARLAKARKSLDMQEAYNLAQDRACVRRY